MKIKCTNKKEFKNLTLDKEYEVIREDGNLFVIKNDTELGETRYSKELFTIIPDRLVFDKELLNIQVTLNNQVRTVVNVSYNGIRIITNNANEQLRLASCSISCGIYQLYNINGFLQVNNAQGGNINNWFRTNRYEEFTVDDQFEIQEEIFKKSLELILRRENIASGFILSSTNLDNNANINPGYLRVLDELSESHLDTENPNSGNRIRLWTFKLTE